MLVGAVVPLWMAVVAGTVGIPTLDDWVYMRGADSLFRSGQIDMPGHTAAVVGQLVLVQPFLWLSHGDRWAYPAFGLVAAALGLVASYALARRFVGVGSAAIVAFSVAAMPGFARESASFMTDVPSFSLAMLSLVFGSMWIERGRPVALALCVGFGIIAASIREFAVAAPAAVLAASWFLNRPKRVWIAVAAAVLVAGLAPVLLISGSVVGRGVPTTSWGSERFILLLPAFATLAAMVLPALTLAIGRILPTMSAATDVLGIGLASLVLVQPWGDWTGGGGNLWTPTGVMGDGLLRGIRDTVIGGRAWAVSAQVAFIAAVFLASLIVHWGQRTIEKVRTIGLKTGLVASTVEGPAGFLKAFAILYALELLAVTSVFSVWDRYLFPLVPVMGILLIRAHGGKVVPGRSLAFSHAALGWLAISAFAINANSFAFDGARWRAGEAAVALGYEDATIDAGYEWVGDHAIGPGTFQDAAYGQAWFEGFMFPQPVCVVILNSPEDAANFLDKSATPLLDETSRTVRVNSEAYRQYLFFGPPKPLYLIGIERSACPTPPVAAPPRIGW